MATTEGSERPDGWTTTTLGEAADYLNGRAFKSTEWGTHGFPIIRIQNLNDPNGSFNYTDREFEGRYKVETGDLLFAWSASLGAYIWRSGPAWLNQHIFRVDPKPFIDRFYLFYFLNNIVADIYSQAHGSGMVHITKKKFNAIPIFVPPLNEQRRIVAKIEELFSELDSGVESLKAARAQLKTYRQSLLKAAFEGRLTEQWRRDNAEKLETADQLLQRIREEREARYQAQLEAWEAAVKKWKENGKSGKKPAKPKSPVVADLGDVESILDVSKVPSAWSIIKIKYLMRRKPQNGRSVKTRDGGFPVLRLTALGDRVLDLSERKGGAWEYTEAKPYLVKDGDFLIARGNGSKALVGRGSLAKGVNEDVAFPDTMIRVSPDECFLSVQYVNSLWESSIVRSQIEANARTTAGIYKINQEHIANIEVPVPHCMEEQREVVRLLESKLSQAEQLVNTVTDAIGRAEILRQSILKRAFEGKLVPQDPNDEPASALLERIRQEQADVPKAGRRKRKAGASA